MSRGGTSKQLYFLSWCQWWMADSLSLFVVTCNTIWLIITFFFFFFFTCVGSPVPEGCSRILRKPPLQDVEVGWVRSLGGRRWIYNNGKNTTPLHWRDTLTGDTVNFPSQSALVWTRQHPRRPPSVPPFSSVPVLLLLLRCGTDGSEQVVPSQRPPVTDSLRQASYISPRDNPPTPFLRLKAQAAAAAAARARPGLLFLPRALQINAHVRDCTRERDRQREGERDIEKKREREIRRERFRQRAAAACQRRLLMISPSPTPLDKTCDAYVSFAT